MSQREVSIYSSNNRALANQERELQVKRMSRLGHSLFILLATVLSFACIALLVADQLYRPDAFVIDRLKIKGHFRYLEPRQIEQLVAEKQVGNFFSIALGDIQQRVESLPWVQDAQVRRQWPDTLLITVIEQRPVMRWGSSKWVNARGDVIELPKQATLDQPIVLEGNDSDALLMIHQAKLWGEKLQANGLELRGLNLSESHAYRLRLKNLFSNNEFELLLGHLELETRLARFLMLFGQQFRGSDQQIHRVDARYPNGLAINASTRGGSRDLASDDLASTNYASSNLVTNHDKLNSFTGNQ
ncbi:MAG: cell division protein FtsQ [Arenicella sp.]|jgi:cell division protein FtsQ